MMFASSYMSEWLSVLSLCEMPMRRGVCRKSRTGSNFVVARSCGLFVRDNHSWRSEDRRYEGNALYQVKDACLKAAATNSTATSNSKTTLAPEHFPLTNFAFSFSVFKSSEVKNEKLQH